MRNITAKRCCGGAESGARPQKMSGMWELKWDWLRSLQDIIGG
ncbi:hypothetical protein RUMHYD_03524 [Blautia hydrogenotrophica DSM 10507]|uniref:Uncharacterized protein n=1 Tax=Blautia hydrogenotrophica (strain DSM 10507 / JCM 14656 / S5a33) TaxID=476272 RepID=C0CRL0_BLAHS|nr:hypothetical protein RUMHYD_03524 [Blautia hydrogenotrophica DSM 10507]